MRDVVSESKVEVRPKGEGFEVVPGGHRRGPTFVTCEEAIAHAESLADRVHIMNRTGKVERVVHSRGDLGALIAECDELVRRDVHKEGDCHWQIGERWSYGEHAGWFIEHHGSIYALGDGEFGEAGPFSSRDDALQRLADHLRSAIAEARECHGG